MAQAESTAIAVVPVAVAVRKRMQRLMEQETLVHSHLQKVLQAALQFPMAPMQRIRAVAVAVAQHKLVPMQQLVAQVRVETVTPQALPELLLHMVAVAVVEHVLQIAVVLEDQVVVAPVG
jgi:3-hydroxyacyl-CoA dehydrogenase